MIGNRVVNRVNVLDTSRKRAPTKTPESRAPFQSFVAFTWINVVYCLEWKEVSA